MPDRKVISDETIVVTINGKSYPTKLYDGVQRFVPDPAVEELVRVAGEHMELIGRPARNFYHLIPDELKHSEHANPIVNMMVDRNTYGYFGLNELAVALHTGEATLEDYIDFGPLHGWSVGGYCDSIDSTLSNLGYEDEAAEEAFQIHNPLWED